MEVNVSKGFELGPFHYSFINNGEHDKDLQARQNWGDCSSTQRRIRVDSGASPQQFRNTYTHELIEAVSVVCCNDSLKHAQVTNLANGLTQIFKSLGIEFVCRKGM